VAGIVVVGDRPGADCIVVVGELVVVHTVQVVVDTPAVDPIESVEDTNRDHHILSQAAMVAYSQGLAY
jgi:hypothetical protein